MATIVATLTTGAGKRTLTETTLTGTTDTFSFTESRGQILILRNPTAGALSPIIDGDGSTSVTVPKIGAVDLSSGYAVGSIAAGAVVAIPLDSIALYLRGTIAITGGTGLVASLLTR